MPVLSSTVLENVFNRLSGELDRMPSLEDVLTGCTPAELSEIAGELKITPDQSKTLDTLRTVLCSQTPREAVPLAYLTKKIPGVKLLVNALESAWFYRWPSLLWAEFDKN